MAQATLRELWEGATGAPLPCRAPGFPGRFDVPQPTADKGRRNAQPHRFELVTPAEPFSSQTKRLEITG